MTKDQGFELFVMIYEVILKFIDFFDTLFNGKKEEEPEG